MGIATVAIYSQADQDALHVALADESYCVGGASPADSYLNEERVISAALVSGAQAIHPGYGFLSENAHFAALCRKNGLVFIGPPRRAWSGSATRPNSKRSWGERPGGDPRHPSPGQRPGGPGGRGQDRLPRDAQGQRRRGGRGIRLVTPPYRMAQAYAPGRGGRGPPSGRVGVHGKVRPPARHIEVRCWPTRPAMWSAWGGAGLLRPAPPPETH